MSFADVGSTSGWLIPTYYAKEIWKIDPKTYWKYHEGATHAANEVAVSQRAGRHGDRFRPQPNAMIEGGKVKPDANKIIWTSAPAAQRCHRHAGRRPAELSAQVQEVLTAITPDQAKSVAAAALHRLRCRYARRAT